MLIVSARLGGEPGRCPNDGILDKEWCIDGKDTEDALRKDWSTGAEVIVTAYTNHEEIKDDIEYYNNKYWILNSEWNQS